MDTRSVSIHGHEIVVRTAGAGPAILLIHGLAGSSTTWRRVIPALAEHSSVIAPDLPGHGRSEKHRGDYSLGNYASVLRDLLLALGHDRATIVGQSLGGGVAMQLAYQYPERTARLVLVDSGGLGADVHLGLRALALPGAQWVLTVGCATPLSSVGRSIGDMLSRIGLRPTPVVEEIFRSYASLGDAETREAFVHTLRSVIDVAGQRVDARDRLYLAAALPTLIVWGGRDRIIPVRHGVEAHDAIPGSRLEIFEDAGHFPHCDEPERFAALLREFIDTTTPGEITSRDLGELLSATQ